MKKSFLTLSTTSKLGRYGVVRLKPIPENDPGLYQKDPLIKVKPKIEEGVILGWLKKEYNNSSHRH